MSTYLDAKVAIPHGMEENKKDVLKTAISVVRLSKPIQWEEDETAEIVVGIAAANDEHIEVLTKLAEAVEDEDKSKQLLTTDDKNVILELLKD